METQTLNQIILTTEQENILEWVRSGSGNGIIEAVAGSGKTFTLIRILELLDGPCAFAAFNKKIAVEIQNKVSKLTLWNEVQVGTFHSFGFSALRSAYSGCPLELLSKNNEKAERLAAEVVRTVWIMEGDNEEEKVRVQRTIKGVPEAYHRFACAAYNHGRMAGAELSPDFGFMDMLEWRALVEHHDLEEMFEDESGRKPEGVFAMIEEGVLWAVEMIKLGLRMVSEYLDFEDMIYAPLALGMDIRKWDYVLVDEAQDLNFSRRELARRMTGPHTRAIFVGDRCQAIYGFSGADAKSFDRIKGEFGCTELPLSVCFRCPRKVVEFAQVWNPRIQPMPTAPEGCVTTIGDSDLRRFAPSKEDAVVCRINAPLVGLFFDLMKAGIGSHVEGREIGEGLIRLITKRGTGAKSLEELLTSLEVYRDDQVEKLRLKKQDRKAAELEDSVEAILIVAENLPAGADVWALKTRIRGMFQDEEGKAIRTLTLSSIHKMKGREFDRVFWWGRAQWNPSPFAKQVWQIEQEDNICYVAATRAKKELFDVFVERRRKRE